jgi:drug/metabolite transporter (DMT)-like permease
MWLALALTCAVCTAAADVLTKRAAAGVPDHVLALARWVYALPFLALVLPFIDVPRPPASFYLLVLVMVPLEIVALLLYIRAIASSPLSLTVPFLSFTPVLLLALGALVLGERVSAGGVTGVLLVAAGAYCMHIGDLRRGLLAPIRAIARERGPRYVLAVAALYAVTSVLGKRAVLMTGPYFFAFFYLAALTGILAPALAAAKRPIRPMFTEWRALLPIGVVLGAATIAQFASYTMAPIAYAIAVKRTSMVLGVIAGRVFFGEGRFGERAVGSLLMLAGVVTIALA